MKTRSYRKGLHERLRDVSYAKEYLKAAIEDGDDAVFFLAVKDVVSALELIP